MRKSWKYLLGLALFCCMHAATAQVEAVATGKVAADQLNSVIKKAQESGDVLIASLGAEAQRALSRFEQIMGDNITKPVDQLDGTLRAEVSALRSLAFGLQRSIDSLPKCLGNEGQLLMAGAKAGLNTSLSSIPAIKGKPLAYLVEDAKRGVPYVVKHNASMGERHLIVRGANLWTSDDVCAVTAKATGFTSKDTIPLAVVSYDQEKVDVRMPADIPNGQWVVTVEAQKKGWFDNCKNIDKKRDVEQVAAGMSIVPPQVALVSLTATPMCKKADTYVYRTKGQITANSCNTDTKDRNVNVGFDKPGYKLQSFDFRDTSNSRGGASARLAGEFVNVRYNAQNRGNSCSHGKGRGSYELVMYGVKELPDTVGQEATLLTQATLNPGESKSFSLAAQAPTCPESANTIAVSGQFEGGNKFALPQITVASNKRETTSSAGVSAFFNGEARVGTVSLEGNTCL